VSSSDAIRESLEQTLDYWRSGPASDSPLKDEVIAEIELAIADGNPLDDEQWDAYFAALEGPDGCNFREVDGKTTWECHGGVSKARSAKILSGMDVSDDDVAAVHRIVDALGGHCDCEILFNAAGRIRPPAAEEGA
jgi:hypothetical protein